MKKILFVLSAFVLSVGVLPAGDVEQASAGRRIENTGPHSWNVIRSSRGNRAKRVKINNKTDVKADVKTDQQATSGDAYVDWNTHGGDAETGDAENENALGATVDVENNNDGAGCNDCGSGSGGDAVIENTGPHSYNKITDGNDNCRRRCGGRAGTRIKNKTDIEVKNETDQEATSGDAYVAGNTTGGDATSGDASNENETDVEVAVSNDNSGATDCSCYGSHGGDATIDTTGPGSTNIIKIGGGGGSGVDINNDTNIEVDNETNQTATTGEAGVVMNTTGGSATSGNASNSNSSSFSFSVSNNN